MLVFRTMLTFLLLIVAAAACSQDVGAQLATTQEKLGAGDLDDALRQLEPLLRSDDLDHPSKQRVRELAARVLHVRGEEHFREARITEAISDFERQVELLPDRAADHWQLGIAYYYAGEYEKGARQFELHATVNPHDVENAVWHFLCVVGASEGSLEAARKRLIPVTNDVRVPMAEIQQLFGGSKTPDEVLKAGKEGGSTARFYADLYVGLYFEALKQSDESLRLLARAAASSAAKTNTMGDVARVHITLRKKKARSNPSGGPQVDQ
jgi:lipoprotein NlpI